MNLKKERVRFVFFYIIHPSVAAMKPHKRLCCPKYLKEHQAIIITNKETISSD